MAKKQPKGLKLQSHKIMQQYYMADNHEERWVLESMFKDHLDFTPLQDKLHTTRDILREIENVLPDEYLPTTESMKPSIKAFLYASMLTSLLNLGRHPEVNYQDLENTWYYVAPQPLEKHPLYVETIQVSKEGDQPMSLIFTHEEDAIYALATFGYLYRIMYGMPTEQDLLDLIPKEEDYEYDPRHGILHDEDIF